MLVISLFQKRKLEVLQISWMVPKGAVRDSFCFLLDTGDDLALHFVRLFIPYVGCLYCQENGSPPVLSALNIFFYKWTNYGGCTFIKHPQKPTWTITWCFIWIVHRSWNFQICLIMILRDPEFNQTWSLSWRPGAYWVLEYTSSEPLRIYEAVNENPGNWWKVFNLKTYCFPLHNPQSLLTISSICYFISMRALILDVNRGQKLFSRWI